MKTKTINKIIQSKFNDWLAHIDDERVKELVASNSIITGGCIASMLLKEPIKDFDVYFKNKETAMAVAQYYVSKFKENNKISSNVKDIDIKVEDINGRLKIFIPSAGVASENSSNEQYDYFEGDESRASDYIENVAAALEDKEVKIPDSKVKYRPLFLSANAITLSDKIQVVIRFYGAHDEIHGNYDFVHCTNYWDSATGKVDLNQRALEALLSKELYYIGSKFPICSIIRTRKFIKRGWTINGGQYLKMCFQISQLDLNNFEILEDQLTGVDVAYFYELLDGLKQHKDKNPTFKLEYGYLSSIIDKIF